MSNERVRPSLAISAFVGRGCTEKRGFEVLLVFRGMLQWKGSALLYTKVVQLNCRKTLDSESPNQNPLIQR